MAPSWHDIASRYRNVPGARQRLGALVLTGSDPNDRHWKGNAAFDRMMANEIATTPEEADLLVRWILSH
jgi:cytochrome c